MLLPALPQLDLPLAEGRLVTALTWLAGSGGCGLLAVACPFPEAGLEGGKGSVLVELRVGGWSWA